MIWWRISFDGMRAGHTGFLRWNGDENTIFDDEGNAIEACDYHVLEMDVSPPEWGA